MNFEWIVMVMLLVFTVVCALAFFGLMAYLAWKIPSLIKAAVSDLDRSYKQILAEIGNLAAVRQVGYSGYAHGQTTMAYPPAEIAPSKSVKESQYDILVREFGKQGYDVSTARDMAAEIVEGEIVKEIGFMGVTE